MKARSQLVYGYASAFDKEVAWWRNTRQGLCLILRGPEDIIVTLYTFNNNIIQGWSVASTRGLMCVLLQEAWLAF